MSEEQEIDLALELLSVSSEAELDQFLGKLFKGAWKGIKNRSSRRSPSRSAASSRVAKTALPTGGRCARLVHSDPRRRHRSRLRARRRHQQGAGGGDRGTELRGSRARNRATVRPHRESAARQVGRGTAVHGRRDRRHAGGGRGGAQVLPNFQFNAAGARPGPGAQQGRWIRRGARSCCSARTSLRPRRISARIGSGSCASSAEFIRFPSVSSDPRHAADMRGCAAWLAHHLRADRARGRAHLRRPPDIPSSAATGCRRRAARRC